MLLVTIGLTEIVFVIAIFGMFGLLAFFMGKDDKPKPKTLPKPEPDKPVKLDIRNKYIMTLHEKTMFNELRLSVPECYIFPQVSFSAILWTPHQATRNKFNRKIADYVITDQNCIILAIIELDDKSHDGKEQQDAERDDMLKQAGYKVLRYRYMPNKEKLRNDILGQKIA